LFYNREKDESRKETTMNKRTRLRPEARGFTLIEILIVIGILA